MQEDRNRNLLFCISKTGKNDPQKILWLIDELQNRQERWLTKSEDKKWMTRPVINGDRPKTYYHTVVETGACRSAPLTWKESDMNHDFDVGRKAINDKLNNIK